MKITGIVRDGEALSDGLVVFFDRRPTDDEMRQVHELLRALGDAPLAWRVAHALMLVCGPTTGKMDWNAAAEAALKEMKP
jgi:hypothetical protein